MPSRASTSSIEHITVGHTLIQSCQECVREKLIFSYTKT